MVIGTGPEKEETGRNVALIEPVDEVLVVQKPNSNKSKSNINIESVRVRHAIS